MVLMMKATFRREKRKRTNPKQKKVEKSRENRIRRKLKGRRGRRSKRILKSTRNPTQHLRNIVVGLEKREWGTV